MNRVRVKDLALVAAAGGLLAFELVSIGEALPTVKKALAERGWSERAEVASASAAGVPLPAVESPAPSVPPAPMASPSSSKAAKRYGYILTASTSAASPKRCVATARARDDRRAHERAHVLWVASGGPHVVCAAAKVAEKQRQIEKAVDRAAKQSTL